MATYSLTTNTQQETIAAWVIKRRQEAAAQINQPYTGPTTTGQLLIEWLTNAFVPNADNYWAKYNTILSDEIGKASDTDTRATILARVNARMVQ